MVAVDADPQACETARRRFRDALDHGRLTILKVGIAAEPGRCDFRIDLHARRDN